MHVVTWLLIVVLLLLIVLHVFVVIVVGVFAVLRRKRTAKLCTHWRSSIVAVLGHEGFNQRIDAQ